MILGQHYITAIKELKRGGNVLILDTPKSYFMASRLVSAGVAKWHSVPDMSYGTLHMLLPTKSPEITPPANVERVQVSFWQQGARAGKFSQEAYKVTGKPRDGFITVELMTGKPYTVKSEYTKAVA